MDSDSKSLEPAHASTKRVEHTIYFSEQSLAHPNPSNIRHSQFLVQNSLKKSENDEQNIEIIEDKKQLKKPVNSFLRFSPANAQPKLLISPSGLLVTCISNLEEIAIAEAQFETGTHYWEIICPKHCKNVLVGVIREGWSLTNLSNMGSLLQISSFKTSTPRVIGMRLDLDKAELCFWLNGNFQPHRTLKNIPRGKWSPCVKLKETGTHIILNPFAVDPDSVYPVYDPRTKISHTQMKCALPQYVVFGINNKIPAEITKFDEILTFTEGDNSFSPVETIFNDARNTVALRFQTAVDAEAFRKANANKKINQEVVAILDPQVLLMIVLQCDKSEKDFRSFLFDNVTHDLQRRMITWVKNNLSSFCKYFEPEDLSESGSLNQISTNLLQTIKLLQENKEQQPQSTTNLANLSEDFLTKFIPKSETLLVANKNSLKLFSQENGRFILRPGSFQNKPRHPSDRVTLSISKVAIAIILSELDLEKNGAKIFRNKAFFNSFKTFLTAVDKALEENSTVNSEEITVNIRYKDAKIFVSGLLKALVSSLNWIKALVQGATDLIQSKRDFLKKAQPSESSSDSQETVLLKIAGQYGESVESQKVEDLIEKEKYVVVFKHLNIEQIYSLLQIFLHLDEALYAMTLHEQASEKLRRYWPNKQPRLFTAFARLGSLLTYPSNKFSLLQLAESGLYNTQDLLYDIRHFLDADKRIEELHNVKENQELWDLLQKSLPNNRMIQGFTSENVPLHVTLNNIPAQNHSTSSEILSIASNEKTSFVSTISANGEVNIWNTELTLVNFCSTNFRTIPPAEKIAPAKKTEGFEESFLSQMNLDDFKQPTQAEAEEGSELAKKFYQMGFEWKLVQKALAQTGNNATEEVVLEKILALQDQEPELPPPQPTKTTTTSKVNTTMIKPKWDCPTCTFVNINHNKLCEICGWQAPPEAYYNEEEKKAEENKGSPSKEEKVAESTGKPTVEAPQNFLETARICDHIIVPLENSPLSPMVVGVMFEDSQAAGRYQLRLRRFLYNSNYLKRFLKFDPALGYGSILSGAWFHQDSKAAFDHLLNEYGLTFTTLEPIFIGNSRYNDISKDGKNSLFCGDLTFMAEQDFLINNPPGKLVKMTSVHTAINANTEINTIFLLWKNESKYLIQQLEVITDYADPNLAAKEIKCPLKIQEVSNTELQISGTTVLLFEVTGGNLVIATDEKLSVFYPGQLTNPINTHRFRTKPRQVTLLSSNTIGFLSENNNELNVIELSKEAPIAIDSQAASDSASPLKSQGLKISELGEEAISSIQAILHKRPLEGMINQQQEGITVQSGYQSLQGKHTKFYLPLDHESLNGSSLQVAFLQPSSLINLELSLNFTLDQRRNATLNITEEREILKNIIENNTVLSRSSSGIEQVIEKADAQKLKLPILNMTESDSGDKFLPLTVFSFQGAAFNESFSVSRIMSPNNDVFSTNYPNSEFVFEHLHGKTMLVKSVTVHSKCKPIGSCGLPLGSGLIFTSNYLAHFDMSKNFQSMTHEQFLEWFKERSREGRELEPWEPVGSFQFDGQNEVVTADLLFVRACKYILMKPTSMRSKPENYAHLFKTNPLEFKFFGASGVVIDDQTTEKRVLSKKTIGVASGSEVVLEAQTQEGEWIAIQTLRDVPIHQLLEKNLCSSFNSAEKVTTLANLPIWGSSLLEISNEMLFQKKITSLRATVSNRQESSSTQSWVVSGVGIQAFVSSQFQVSSEINLSPVTLRKLMLDRSEFARFNKTLVEEIKQESLSQHKRKQIIELISEILSAEPGLIDLFYQHLDIRSFILNSVLRERNFTFLEIQNFLRHFSSQATFAENLLNTILELIPHLKQISIINHVGLNGFFSLLTWCQTLSQDKVFATLLKELHALALEIGKIRTPNYNVLRTVYNIPSLVFEEQLFSDASLSLGQSSKKKGKEDQERQKGINPLKSKILAFHSNTVDEYLLDLTQKSKIREIKLAFDQTNQAVKFKVQIWAVNSDENGKQKNVLLHSKFYSESTWIQLTNYAYDKINNENNYKASEELECLGFSNLNAEARYVLVQITYALLPLYQLPEKNDKKIIPEVYGEHVNGGEKEGEIPSFQTLFSCKNITMKDTLKFPHTGKYERFEVNEKGFPFKYIFDSTETLGKNISKDESGVTEESQTVLLEKLRNLQHILSEKITAARTSEDSGQNIPELCEEIETLQSKLFELQNKEENFQLSNPSTSLDYLFTLASKFSQALRRLDSQSDEEHRTWRKDSTVKSTQGKEVAYDIFANLIAYEASPLNKEFVSLLSEVLVNNLNENEWHTLIFTIINTFLTKSINIRTSPAESVFSHRRLIEVLQKIGIPTNELLTFLLKKLNIPTKLSILTDQKLTSSQSSQEGKDTKTIVCTLSSVLILLNDGYKKIQSENSLAPPGMKRSVSSTSKDAAGSTEQKAAQGASKEEVSEVKKLSNEESFQAALSICVWISENSSLNKTDKANLLVLGLDLVLHIIRYCKITGIKDLLRNPNSFLKLFILAMRLDSSVILAKFQALLNAFLNPKTVLKTKKQQQDAQQPNEDEIIAEHTKILLICHLQTILKSLIDYALQPEAASFYFNISKDELSQTTWHDNLCFILEFLLTTIDKLNINPNQEDLNRQKKQSERKRSVMVSSQDLRSSELPTEGYPWSSVARGTRSASMNLETKPKEFNAETFDKSNAIPLELVTQLIKLLSSDKQRDSDLHLGSSTKGWFLVMKTLSKIKVTFLIEANIMEHLLASFLEAGDHIQQTMFQEIVDFTQNMLKYPNNQKELSNIVLQVLFKTLDFLEDDQYNPTAFSLLKGWLDTLLTSSSPKPETYHAKPPEKAFCKLNAQGAYTLFIGLSKYLWNHLNLGSKDGVLNCSELNINKLQIAADLIRLLTTSESTSNLLAIGELFSNFKKYSEDIKTGMKFYVEWFLLNRATDAAGSPSTELIQNISENVMKMFKIIPDYQEVTKAAIAALINGCRRIDQTLLKMTSTQQLTSYTIIQFNARECNILKELFNIWVTNDAVASLASFEVQGFEYLLERMGVSLSGEKKLTSTGTEVSLLEGTDLLDQMPLQKDEIKGEQRENNLNIEDPKEEEFANKLSIICQPGQTWSGIPPDWSVNKKGVKARILFFQMNNNFYNEYCLVFNLEKTIELKQIKIGFNTVWTDYNDKVLGIPSSVLIEGGTSLGSFTPLATLEPINDEGYSNFSVRVFHKNFQTISGSSHKTLEASLESLGSRKVSYLKFRFRRPTVTFIEGLSTLSSKSVKNVAVSISFISITGFDAQKLPNTKRKIVEVQENSALQVISKLCNEQYTETLQRLAHDTNIVNRLKSSFDSLARLLVNFESYLAPVFQAIATYNDQMGDWIMSKFLDLSRTREHAKLVGEIILSNKSLIYERLTALHNFVLSELKKILNIGKTESMNKFSALVPFIEVLNTSLRSIPPSYQPGEKVPESQVFRFDKEDADVILRAFEVFNASVNNKVLVKLVLLYLYMPAPFTITGEGLIKYVLDRLWETISKENKSLYYEMLGPVIIGSNASAKWFANHIETVLADLIQKLEGLDRVHFQALRHSFILLNNVSSNTHIKRKITSNNWHLKLYNSLKNKEDEKTKTILRDIDSDILKLAVQFFKNVAIGYPQVEEELSQAFIKDLALLETKRDLSFVNKLLVPLLNAELEVPVCLYPYDSQAKRAITGTRHLPTLDAQAQGKETVPSHLQLASQLLDKKHAGVLMETVNRVTKSTGLSRKIANLPWELAIQTQVDGKNVLADIRDKMSKQGPFLIITEGTNSGKKCFIGVFCSQSMAELPQQFDTTYDQLYPIPMADDNFLFYYDDHLTLHFPITSSQNQSFFAQVHSFYDGGGGISFYYNNIEKFFLSFSTSQSSYVDVLSDMKLMEEDEEIQSLPANFTPEFNFKAAELFVLKPLTAEQQVEKEKTKNKNTLSSVLYPNWYSAGNPRNYFRATPVYIVPASLTVSKLTEIFLKVEVPLTSTLTNEKLDPKTTLTDLYEFVSNDPNTNNIIDMEFDVLEYFEKLNQGPPIAEAESGDNLKYKPVMTLFEAFEKSGGVQKIIEIALKSVENWKNKEKSQRWLTWLHELETFSVLPNFFGLFLKNKECIELLFQILAGVPDDDKEQRANKKWEEEEQKAVKASYQILANVFSFDSDIKLREFAIEQNFFERILDRVSLISKEVKRKWVDTVKKDSTEEAAEKGGSPTKGEDYKEDDFKKKIVKKKGVGYASDNTGQNQRWNVNEYVESKKVKNEQLQQVIDIIHNFINVKGWHPPKSVLQNLYESALLPLLESAFRSASLLDMAKDAELYQAYLQLTRAISQHRTLIPALLDIDQHYQPLQKDSVYTLLTNLKDLAQIFMNCLTTADKDATAPNQKLAQDILNTYKIIDEAIQDSHTFEESDTEETFDISAQPLAVSYRSLLQNLRFDYVNMKDPKTARFKHHYVSYISNNAPPQQKMVRLAQELADLSNALPIEHTNSIFVRVDESRVDVMKALVMGSAGTPYGHGAYEFDIYFDDSYPNGPPKVNLTTTGGGKVRFNPNLYSCGKVCLSLLGTWRGNASENWDPKLSTLLQVLVSIQAIIMSEEIYFNEPGFEGEAGTEEGEKKNEAYSNIVRYCNIKYAMIDQMKNPPKGFETVIKRHFYLKKNEILDEVRKWQRFAEHREASYIALVNDHNTNWCSEFKTSKTKYRDMLTEAVKELETELEKLQPPSMKDVKQKTIRKKEKKAEKVNINAGVANLEDIDVSYDKPDAGANKEMNIEDEGVKDRWSRYIGAMGLDAVTKQANASIFLSGLGALGIEITKNIVLSGVKRFTIHDSQKTTYRDLSGQFYLGEEDLGKNRAAASLNKIQQLNYYVKVDTAGLDKKLPKEEAEIDKLLKGYTLVILMETDYETQIAFNNYCRKNKIYFISTDAFGPFAGVFSDFGDEFVVVDKNGEELQEVMIGSISNDEEGVVKLLAGHSHKFEDGDEVVIHGVEGMELLDKSLMEKNKEETGSINGTKHKISTINAHSFKIQDTKKYSPYVGNGLAKQLRIPKPVQFQSLEKSLFENIPFDQNMIMHDFLKISHPNLLHIAFQALDAFKTKHNDSLPRPWNVADSDEFITFANEISKKVKDFNLTEDKQYEFLLRRFSFTCQGVFAPLTAFLGGYVAQEAIKAITQKFMPTQQFFYTDCSEVIPDLPEKKEEFEEAIKALKIEQTNHRSDGLRIIIGEKLLDQLAYANLFMVGSGAIGCELLKNYAMLGLGTGAAGVKGQTKEGRIILTDPDVIEVSNLNRQFLFREKHLRKPKSQTAAAAALQMNKELKGHVIARLDKVHEGTANVFTDKFFEELTVVTNALDNVQARRYIDSRCVNAKTPLLESGTLGPKGHVQVILPYKTESYSSQEDPQEDAEIPHCTLKMFPEEALHCVEWARDKFGKIFTQRPKGLLKVMEDPNLEQIDSQEIKAIREALRLLQKRPSTFDDCIRYARNKFQKYFVNDIRQLLYTYPLDAKTKEGRPFWSLPKRPPTELTFDPEDILHASFVTACACLRANVFNIPIPVDARKNTGKLAIAAEAAKIKVVDYKPSDEKAKAISSEVDKSNTKQASGEEAPEDDAKTDDIQYLLGEIKKLANEIPASKGEAKGKVCQPEEFEKDNDQNFHIDFIYSIANCRASNYKLEPMEWMTVKIKAGRIIPALATTTASVAGLQTIELCKLIKNCKVDDMKNAFLSLAVPIMALSEPAKAPTTKLSEKLTVSIWDRWEIKLPRSTTLKQTFEALEKTYELVPKDVNYGSQTIYFHALMDIKGKEKEKEDTLNTKLEELLSLEKEDKYVDLSIMFARKGETEILKGVPLVRVTFEEGK